MVYRTMQGKVIDLEKLMRQNELTPAVGNMRVNARGDVLGSAGEIVKKREDVVAEYYSDNPNAKPKRSHQQEKPKAKVEEPPKPEPKTKRKDIEE